MSFPMRLWVRRLFRTGMAMALAASLTASSPEPPPDKNVSYDGGLVLVTNGSLPNGVCFRLAGRVTAPNFFDNLKRVDGRNGATFRRGSEIVTAFPDRVLVVFVIHDWYDQTCPPRAAGAVPQHLTRDMMSSLNLYLYWKHGIELRPIANVEPKYFGVEPIIPYAATQAHNLPEKFEWAYEYAVPSTGVPLSDSLVLIIRTPDGRMAARVAARF